MAINPHRKGGPDVPIEDGGTNASNSTSALSNLGALAASYAAAATHAMEDHTGLPGIPAATPPLQVSTFHFPSGTSISTGALGFTPSFALFHYRDITQGGLISGISYITGTTGGQQMNIDVNNFNGASSSALGRLNAAGPWTCSQFSSAGINCNGTQTLGVILAVIGQ